MSVKIHQCENFRIPLGLILAGLQEESHSIINLIHHVVDIVLTNKEKWEATEVEQKEEVDHHLRMVSSTFCGVRE